MIDESAGDGDQGVEGVCILPVEFPILEVGLVGLDVGPFLECIFGQPSKSSAQTVPR